MAEEIPTEHDDMLLHLLKECKTLPTFLDHIFGFLRRRTDFYHVNSKPGSPVGLPPGVAERILNHAYFKWMPRSTEKSPQILQECEVPEVVAEEVVIAENNEELDIAQDIGDMSIQQSVDKPRINDEPVNSSFSESESYNGAVYDIYCWSQTIADVDVNILVPENVTAKDLTVSILNKYIVVKQNDEILLEGELCQKCKHNEAIWSIDKRRLQIHLDKCKEMWWDCLITSEARLDLSKIDSSRPFEDLPEDAQAKIEELTWNQERKRLGLPTSDEIVKQDILRTAWNAEGSPFSGPFDPSKVSFN